MKNLPELKIMIIGPREAGRTLLARRLSGQAVKREDVIEIYECEADYAHNTYKLQIWDFSDKEIHHATHQLFFTSQSLYILVDDTRASEKYIQDEYFQYWFEVVKSYGQESPMIIVQNEKGGRSKDIAVSEIQEKYPFFKSVYALDLQKCSDREIAVLKDDILRLGQPVVQTFDTFHLDGFRNAVKSQVDSSMNHLTVQDVRKLCSNHCGSEQYHFEKTLAQLHNLGIIFNFKQFETLQNWVILDRNWLVSSIYKILDSPTAERQDGKFTWIDIKQILNRPEYNGTHQQVIHLMEKFYLCYAVGKNTWMAPQLFKSNPAKMDGWGNWPYIKEYYAKFTFLPKGLVEQLLVRSYKEMHLFEPWLGGFCFDKYDTRLIVAEQWTEKTILFRFVQGNQIPQMARFIVKMLEEVSKIHRVGFELEVPCTCNSCTKSPSPAYYKYEEDLLQRREKNQLEIECYKTYDKVVVDDILQKNIADPLPPVADSNQAPEIDTKSSTKMNGILKISTAILVLSLGIYWFFTSTATGAKIRVEWLGVKVEAEQGGVHAPENKQPEAAIGEKCNVEGRVKIGGKWATKKLVSSVKFANQFTLTSDIKEGGIYRFENFPRPSNEKAILEVTLIGTDEPLSIVVDVNTRNGKEITYHDAILNGTYDQKNGNLKTVIYNGQTIIIKGNGNSVNQNSQKGNDNSNSQELSRPDSFGRKN